MSEHAIPATDPSAPPAGAETDVKAGDGPPTVPIPAAASAVPAGIAALALRRIRPLSLDWAAVVAAGALAVAVSLGWKVTW